MRLARFKKPTGVATALVVVLAAVMVPAAGAATPAKGYEQFAGCPSPMENPSVALCLHSVVTGGNFQMGTKNVPITSPITISGGFEYLNGPENELKGFIANSKGGLLPAKQKVPGGIIGLTGLTWLAEVLGSEALTLYAVTELVDPPQLYLTHFHLPIRVHLINATLGNNCYVGSASNPITLNLTTGTTSPPPPNTSISGTEPELGFEPVKEIILAKGGTYVDNSFSAPAASGCKLTLFGFLPVDLDPLVDLQSGLPSAAGHNETIQHVETEIGFSELVYP